MIYNYTLAPLAMPSFDMALFIIPSIIISLFLCLLVGFILNGSNISDGAVGNILGVITSVVTIIVFIIVFNHYRNTPIPKNEQVCGHMIGFDSSFVGSKTKQLAGFVQYQMCDGSGIVTLRTDEQKSYPKELIFYKNVSKQ